MHNSKILQFSLSGMITDCQEKDNEKIEEHPISLTLNQILTDDWVCQQLATSSVWNFQETENVQFHQCKCIQPGHCWLSATMQ